MIDRSDSRPAYQRVADDLRAAIVSNRLQAGDRLPSERELARRHGIAQMTVRQALSLLRGEGLVDAIQGRGVFVRAQLSRRRLGIDRYSRARRGRGQTPFMVDTSDLGPPRFEAVRFGPAPADPAIAGRLDLNHGALVLVTSLRCHAGEQAMQLSTAYLPHALAEGSPLADPSAEPWQVDTITNLESVGIRVTEIAEDISARAGLAEELAALNCRAGTPVFVVQRTMFANLRPVETCDIVMPADRYLLTYRFPVP